MLAINVPKHFLKDIILTSTHLVDRMPSKVLNFQTPIETLEECYLYRYVFNYFPLKVLGSIIFVYVSNKNRSKLDSKAIKCIFLRIFFNPKMDHPLTKRKFVTIDVIFFLTTILYKD